MIDNINNNNDLKDGAAWDLGISVDLEGEPCPVDVDLNVNKDNTVNATAIPVFPDSLDEALETGYAIWRNQTKHKNFTVLDLLNIDTATEIKNELLKTINNYIAEITPSGRSEYKQILNDRGIKQQVTLPPGIITRLILDTHEVKLLKTPGSKSGLVIVKRYENGEFSGIWQIIFEKGENPVKIMAMNFIGHKNEGKKANDVYERVRAEVANSAYADKYLTTKHYPDTLVPCYNGVYDGRDHTFTKYTDADYDKKYGMYTFIIKLDTAYKETAQVPPDFDPVKFLRELFNDTEKDEAQYRILLQAMQFTLRIYSGKEGYILFLNNVMGKAGGHNGKSTFLQLLSFLIEHEAANGYAQRVDRQYYFSNGQKVINLSIDKWGDRFALGPHLLTMVTLIGDESEEGGVIYKTGKIKNIARKNRIDAEAKFQDSFSDRMTGVAWNAQNDYTKMGTKDNATFTHRIDLSFEKDFSAEGGGNTDIIHKHIVREDVGEYLLKYLMDEVPFADDYNADDLALVAENTLDVKFENLPSWRCFDEILPQLTKVPEVPVKMIYGLYEAWCESEGIGYNMLSLIRLGKDLAEYCKSNGEKYEYVNGTYTTTKSIQKYMTYQELPILVHYYKGRDGKMFDFIATKYGEGKSPSGHIRREYLDRHQFSNKVIMKECMYYKDPYYKDPYYKDPAIIDEDSTVTIIVNNN